METFNPDSVENSARRVAEALEKILSQLQMINTELRQIKENVRHKVQMEEE